MLVVTLEVVYNVRHTIATQCYGMALEGRCVSASVATVDRCPGRGRALHAADDACASILAVPNEVGTGSA